jgi:hypothetical protein
MAKRTNQLDWSQKLFIACFCTGSLVLGGGGAVKASRMIGGEATVADAASSETPTSTDVEAPETAQAPEPDADRAEVADRAKPAGTGETKGATGAAQAGALSGENRMRDRERQVAFAAIVNYKGDEFAAANGLSQQQMDEIAAEGRLKGWGARMPGSGDVDDPD